MGFCDCLGIESLTPQPVDGVSNIHVALGFSSMGAMEDGAITLIQGI
jgi:hypothetical protein